MRRKKGSNTRVENISGISVIPEGRSENQKSLFDLFCRGLLLFLIMTGTVGCFTTSFEISFYVWPVFLLLLFVDLFLGLIFYKNRIKNIGYIALFVGFLFGVLRYARYIVSGFYGIANVCFSKAGAAMNLSNVMTYNETISDSKLAITFFLIFYGIGLSTLLNALISNYMSIGGVMFVTLPITLTGFYFGFVPDFIYGVIFISGLVTLYAAKKSIKVINGRSMFQFMGMIAVLAAIFLLCVNFIFPSQRIGKPQSLKKVRSVTDDYVSRFLSGGLLGMFNRYRGAGGMSGGELGGVAIVNPDYETDLVVRMVPYTSDTLYLKGFTGISYDRTRWITGDYSFEENSSVKTRESNMNRESSALAKKAKKDSAVLSGIMDITNVDADTGYRYLPYYPVVKEDENVTINEYEMVIGKSPLNATYSVTFYPDSNKVESTDKKSSEAYAYLAVPEENYETVANFCREAGLTPDLDKETIVERLGNYFQTYYPYTKRPGIMPRRSDFVNYFLAESKTGYCAHFASAATLIFRYLGYEARYVEGYCIPFSRVREGTPIENQKVSDYLSGEPLQGYEKVVDVEVDDSTAHAWTEIFVPGSGWQIVDVTPASMQEEEGSNSFGFLADLFGRRGQDSQSIDGIVSEDYGIDWARYRILGIVVAVFAGLASLCMLVHLAGRRYLTYCRLHHENRKIAVTENYREFCRKMRKKYPDFSKEATHKQQLSWIKENLDSTSVERRKASGCLPEEFVTVSDILKKAVYSEKAIEEKEYQYVVRVIDSLKKAFKI